VAGHFRAFRTWLTEARSASARSAHRPHVAGALSGARLIEKGGFDARDQMIRYCEWRTCSTRLILTLVKRWCPRFMTALPAQRSHFIVARKWGRLE
jgi:hypothetical protein